MYKKVWCTCEVVVWLIQPIVFLTFSLSSALLDLQKSPYRVFSLTWPTSMYKFIGTKESVSIRKEFNSHRTGLGHQHGRCFVVLGQQYGRRDVMRKHPQLKHQSPVFGLAHYKMNITFTIVLMTKKEHRSYLKKRCLKSSFLWQWGTDLFRKMLRINNN